MKPRSTKSSAPASLISARLASAERQINVLDDQILPHTPHLLQIPSNPLPEPHYDFWKNNLFNKSEGRKIEYLTLLSSADRGICLAQGNFEDETNKAGSPFSTGSQTGTSTPHAVRDGKSAKVKLSIADYKNYKTTGVKPAPRPATATPDTKIPSEALNRKSLHTRNTSAASNDNSMSRVPSFEGGDTRLNGTSASINEPRAEKNSAKEEKSAPARSNPVDSRNVEKPRPVINGNAKRDSLQMKDANKDPRPTRPDVQRYDPSPTKRDHRARSPHRDILETKQAKRPLDSVDVSQPEKRTKIETSALRAPLGPQKSSTQKALPSETKPSPSKAPKASTSTQASSPPKKVPSTTRPLDTKTHNSKSAGDKPHIPPLLSPLPADISVPAQSNFTSLKKSEVEKSASPKTPSQKQKPITATSSDTIIVKSRHVKNAASISSPRSTPTSSTPPFVLPRMLSPGLPDAVEAELTRLSHKKTTPNNNTVEARYEKVRQPGAPGVPQKASRSNIGHPPKKSQAESSHTKKAAVPEMKQLIVRMKYKKRQANDIQRMLRLRPYPTDDFKEMEKRRMQTDEGYTAPVHFDTDSEEEDVPIPRTQSSKTPANTTARKRVPHLPLKIDSEEDSDTGGAALTVQANRVSKLSEHVPSRKRPAATEPDRTEPAPKRPKQSDSGIAKPSTPLAPGSKTPTITGSSVSRDNLLLTTPKRSEVAKKSTVMGRVMSSDGSQARTPKPAVITSTPASSEKVRINGHRPEVDQAQVEHASRQHKTFFNLGTLLKRHLQSKLVNDKSGSSSAASLDAERKKAVMKGVESIMAYMLAFHFANQMSTMRGHSILPESWKDLFPVWNFVNSVATPYSDLSVLLSNLAAVSREQMCRIFVEAPAESRDNEAFVAAYKDRDKLWSRAKAGQFGLRKLSSEGNGILGPWATVPEAIAFAGTVLEKYAAAQKIDDWKGEESLKHAVPPPQPRMHL